MPAVVFHVLLSSRVNYAHLYRRPFSLLHQLRQETEYNLFIAMPTLFEQVSQRSRLSQIVARRFSLANFQVIRKQRFTKYQFIW